jgi:hypothetical protein
MRGVLLIIMLNLIIAVFTKFRTVATVALETVSLLGTIKSFVIGDQYCLLLSFQILKV